MLDDLEPPAATIEVVGADPAKRWPVDWSVSGEARGRAEWSAKVYAPLREWGVGRGLPVQVVLRTQMGVFSGEAYDGASVIETGGGTHVELSGSGPLTYRGPLGEVFEGGL